MPLLGLRIFTVFILCLVSISLKAGEQDWKVEDILARHLESIGTAEARHAIKNRHVSGTVVLKMIVGGYGLVSGKSQMLSEGRKFRLAMDFDQLDYPGEEVVFDGDKLKVGQISPNKRSQLEAFFYACDFIPKEGLLGGVLSTAWPLLDVVGRQVKLSYSGLVKIDGEPLHEIVYQSKKTPLDLRITLYFDPETFRHVRTQYRLIRESGLSLVPAGDQNLRCTLTETFAQFQRIDGLTLPQQTHLQLMFQQPFALDSSWIFTIMNTAHNQAVASDSFTIRKK
jgi:hypothetical protein